MAARKQSDERVETGRVEIGNRRAIVFAVQSYRGKIGLDVRHWYLGDDGVERPDTSRGGVRLYRDDLEALFASAAFYDRTTQRHKKRAYRVSVAPRATGTAPRDKKTNPKAKGTNPRAAPPPDELDEARHRFDEVEF